MEPLTAVVIVDQLLDVLSGGPHATHVMLDSEGNVLFNDWWEELHSAERDQLHQQLINIVDVNR